MKLTILLMIILTTLATNDAYALDVFHEIKEEQIITEGVLHTQTSLVTNIGWLDVNVLQVDLTNFNVKVAPIDAGVFDTKQTIYKMATDTGAVAAVNADFFSLTSTVPSFGAAIADGAVKQIYSTELAEVGPEMNMASVFVDKNLNILMDYIDTTVSLHASNGEVAYANGYNKIGTYFNLPVVLDDQYTATTNEITAKFPRAATLVIKNGVVALHKTSGAVDIPKNGFAVVMDNSFASEMFRKFPIGMPVTVHVDTALSNKSLPNFHNLPEINELIFGIGGGGLILQDGHPYLGAANIVGKQVRHPRTLIATTDKFGELLLITIDGRQYSAGATHDEVIQILLDLGAKDAMYLDGGGSTTMVARDRGEFDLSVQNLPSDGAQRKVMNGLGIFSINKPDKLDDIHLTIDRSITAVGEPITFAITGIDQSSNPIELNDYNIEIIGIEADITDNNTIVPKTAGNAFIVASKDGVESEVKIHVAEKLVGIEIEPAVINLNVGAKQTVKIIGTTNEGDQIEIAAAQLSDPSELLKINNYTISSTKAGVAVLKASYHDLTAAASIVIGAAEVSIESFEDALPTWFGDTPQVSGSVKASTWFANHGKRAVAVNYTFSPNKTRSTAIVTFPDPLILPTDSMRLNLMVRGNNSADTLKIEVMDQSGKIYFLTLANELDFDQYRKLSVDLPAEIDLPARVTSLYISAPTTAKKTSNTIYFDNLTATRGNNISGNFGTATDHTFDPLYTENFRLQTGEYYINIIGPTHTNSFMLAEDLQQSLTSALTADGAQVIMASKDNIPLDILNAYRTNFGFWQTIYKDVQLVYLDTSNHSIIDTNTLGWSNIKNVLDNTSKNHIILVTEHNPLTGFSNTKEGTAFHDYLASLDKNVFVITTTRNKNEVQIIDNVRYINTIGLNISEDDLAKASFLQFKVEGNRIYYTFRNISP